MDTIVKDVSVFCADVGSIRSGKFGWAGTLQDSKELSGTSIADFAAQISEQIERGSKVAIGFECPLFVPVRDDPIKVNSARVGEGNRSWSAGAGTVALATGIVEVLWVMREVSMRLQSMPKAEFDWTTFLETDSVFIWEAFVTSGGKGASHAEDASIAVRAFVSALPNPVSANAVREENVLSLVGAAALRAGWSSDIGILAQPCLVIKV